MRTLWILLPVLSLAGCSMLFGGKSDDDDDDDDDEDDTALVSDDSGWTGGDDTGGGDEGGGDEGGGDEGGGDEGGGDEGGGDEGGGDEGGGTEVLCATDHAWAIYLQRGSYVSPAGVAELIIGEFDNTLLIGFSEATSASATLVVGTTDGAEQDTCVPTDTLRGTWFNPSFSVGPDDITLRGLGYDFGASGMSISGIVSEDCDLLTDVTLETQLDVREMGDAANDLLGISDPEEICATMTGFGVSCVACPDGQDYCLDVRIEDLEATSVSDPIVRRTESQVLADATCDGVGSGCESVPVPNRRTPFLPLALLPGLAIVALRRR